MFCNDNLKEGSTIAIKVGNINQYDGERNHRKSIEVFNSSGNLVNSVKKEARKESADAATHNKASAAEHQPAKHPTTFWRGSLNLRR